MILECPACHARFLVPDQLIPAAGRTVKCGKCANQWHVENVAAATQAPVTPETAAEPTPAVAANEAVIPHTPAPMPEMRGDRKKRAKVPAKKTWALPVKPFKLGAPVLALCWAALAVYTYFPTWHVSGPVAPIYPILGVTDTEGLAFADVSMERAEEGSQTKFLLKGSIANQSSKPRLLPKVRVQLKDKENIVFWARNYPVGETVEPGASYPFRVDDVATNFADKTASIVIDLGNNFELMTR